MTPDAVLRRFYGAHPGPERASQHVARLMRQFGASAVYGHAMTAKREAPAAGPHDDTPLVYLEALCRIEDARARKRESVA